MVIAELLFGNMMPLLCVVHLDSFVKRGNYVCSLQKS